ncbi:MAG: tRNA pseudouridine(55) synthase TruB [Planctomycetia bacterium 21-64-5]|nr:MAG: tRNA pseudouridine(55) synthase TruB [Planctomycetia bacterium 21-64-5]HQU45047.1 tRNA pseudouridine(55) synthase TruB [Pirellulales bacterium]
MTAKKPFGIVNLHKPPGMTSREAVDCVKRLVRPAKTGHAGTLDPLATGVLVVCVGPATRLIEYVQAMPKRYRAVFLLGRESDTEDIEGQVRSIADARQPTEAEIRAAAARLVGVIEQRPPAYSALKVQGRRAYDLARAGKAVVLAPRPVVVHRLEVVAYDYPELRLDIECGSGTYVRSLGRDLAQSVGTAAVMSELVRTAIGCFTLADAKLPEQLLRDQPADWLQSPLRALSALPRIILSAGQIERLGHGQTIHGQTPSEGEMAAVDEHEELVAIVSAQSDGTLRPVQNFAVGDRG